MSVSLLSQALPEGEDSLCPFCCHSRGQGAVFGAPLMDAATIILSLHSATLQGILPSGSLRLKDSRVSQDQVVI